LTGETSGGAAQPRDCENSDRVNTSPVRSCGSCSRGPGSRCIRPLRGRRRTSVRWSRVRAVTSQR